VTHSCGPTVFQRDNNIGLVLNLKSYSSRIKNKNKNTHIVLSIHHVSTFDLCLTYKNNQTNNLKLFVGIKSNVYILLVELFNKYFSRLKIAFTCVQHTYTYKCLLIIWKIILYNVCTGMLLFNIRVSRFYEFHTILSYHLKNTLYID